MITSHYLEVYARRFSRRHEPTGVAFEVVAGKLSQFGDVVPGDETETLSPIRLEERDQLAAEGFVLYQDQANRWARIVYGRVFRVLLREGVSLDEVHQVIEGDIVATRLVCETSFDIEAR